MGLARSAMGLMAARALGALSALGFTVVVAARFGSDRVTDVAFGALILPSSLTVMLGALLPPVIVTVFRSAQVARGEEEAWRFVRCALRLLLLGAALLTLLGSLASPLLARAVGPGFVPADVVLCARYMALSFLLVWFSVFASVLKGVMNANSSFLLPALDTFSLNAASIAIVLAGSRTWGALTLVAAAVAGNLAKVLIVLPSAPVRRLFATPAPWTHPELRTLGMLLWPMVFQTVLYALNALVIRALATRIPMEGALSHITYAEKLAYMPGDLLILAIGTVLLPSLATSHARADREETRRLVTTGIRVSWMLAVPAAVGLFLLSEPVVRLLFERGAFDRADSQQTAAVLRILALSLLAGGQVVLSQALYAAHRTKSILLVGVLSLATNAGLGWTLVGPLRQSGLAWAATASQILAFLAYSVIYLRTESGLDGRGLITTLWKVAIATGAMAVLVELGQRYTLLRWSLPASVCGLVSAGAIAYAAVLWLLRAEEWKYLRRPTDNLDVQKSSRTLAP